MEWRITFQVYFPLENLQDRLQQVDAELQLRRREMALAFTMANHKRLGQNASVSRLGADLTRLILNSLQWL
jgi:hypothetical protein